MKNFNLIITFTSIMLFIALGDSIAQWQKIELPETNVPVSTQAVAAIRDTLFVGTYLNTIYRSKDQGLTWTKSDVGIHYFSDFFIDDSQISIVKLKK